MRNIAHLITVLIAILLMYRTPARATEFFVSPGGNDLNSGTKDAPFATLEKARSAVRVARATSKMEPITVWLNAGKYNRVQPFELTAEDSGTKDSPVIYRAISGGTVRLDAAKPIEKSAFRPVNEPQTLARIAKPLREEIFELDLKALGISNIKRFPELFNDNGGIIELFCDGLRMPLSRYPNSGNMTIKIVLLNGGGQTTPGQWGTGKSSAPAGGVFEYRDDRSANWAAAVASGDVWLKGYWRCVWEVPAIRVQAIDTAAHTITLAKPSPGGIGSKYHRPAGDGKEAYWLVNLLEEVDSPGEWCLDFKSSKLYFYPPKPIMACKVEISDMKQPIVHLQDVSYTTFRDIVFEGGLGNGIEVRGGTAVQIAGCTLRNLGKNGIVIDGGSAHVVQSCDLYALGGGGVWLSGGDEKSTPRVAAGHRVVNNHIHHFAINERVYAAGINSGFTGGGGGGHHAAVGMYIAHNLIHDTPHVGILHGSWDTVFEYNEFFRYCQVSGDMGAIYCYDRYEQIGNQILRYNFAHTAPKADGFYFDGDHHDEQVYGNISQGMNRGFLYKNGVSDANPLLANCHDNLAVDCQTGFRFVMREGSKVYHNSAVHCVKPFEFIKGKQSKGLDAQGDQSSGENVHVDSVEVFMDAAHGDYRVKPSAIPVMDWKPLWVAGAQVGLQVDEYRKKLPTDPELNRFGLDPIAEGVGYRAEDTEGPR